MARLQASDPARTTSLREFRLASVDGEVAAAMTLNAERGLIRLPFGVSALFDKWDQHKAIRAIDPGMAFACERVDRVADLPSEPGATLVVRPTVSPSSKGSAIVYGPGRRLDEAARSALREADAGLVVHSRVPGQPIFVNTVMRQGRLTPADTWRCLLLASGCRDVLVSVTNLRRAAMPDGLLARLERLANGLGLINGPVHFELVVTEDGGAKVVKCVPRIATDPLPALCELAGVTGQQALWQAIAAADPNSDVAAPPEATVTVADYSFILSRGGRIAGLSHGAEIEALASFSHYHQPVEIGAYRAATVDGYSYGATIFLRHGSMEVVERDIAWLHGINQQGAFLLADDMVGADRGTPPAPKTARPA